MPTYEALLSVVLLFVMWGLARFDLLVGVLAAGIIAAGCLHATFAWGLYFGGPVLLLGDVLGFVLGRVSKRI
ncbi:MAG: hypothetical protein ACRDJN_13885 [Chloroflexota bacterium]